jgi:RNA polymerase sigma-70 factor (ECF subfamily)
MENSTATELQLMTVAKSGDQNAFSQLVDRLSDRIYGLAYRLLSNDQDAKDVAQETFVRMWQSRKRWTPKGAVSTWAYRITTNLCLNQLRSRKRWQMQRLEPESDDGIGFDIPATEEDSPQIQMENKETKEHLNLAVSQLPPRERAAVILRHQQELSGKEIAKILNTTIYGVDSLLFRARKHLRKIFDQPE